MIFPDGFSYNDICSCPKPDDVLWTPARADGTTYYETINQDSRGRIDPFFGILYNYYKYVENKDMTQEKYKYLAYAYETRMPEGASDDYSALYARIRILIIQMANQPNLRLMRHFTIALLAVPFYRTVLAQLSRMMFQDALLSIPSTLPI